MFAALGVPVGLIAGMFGVGGGIITVPVLIACFLSYNFDNNIVIHLAIGTSLACIFFTGISSANSHRNKQSIDYAMFKPIALGIILGAILGAIFAIQIEGQVLRTIIGCFALLVAIQIGSDFKIAAEKARKKNNKEAYVVGTSIGFLSSILGIGGGIFSVPYLKSSGLTMIKSVGTSAACGIPIAFFGAIGYLILGLDNENLPTYTLGYIYLPALIGVSLSSIVSAKYGAEISHHISEISLRRLMASMMLIISIYMVAA